MYFCKCIRVLLLWDGRQAVSRNVEDLMIWIAFWVDHTSVVGWTLGNFLKVAEAGAVGNAVVVNAG